MSCILLVVFTFLSTACNAHLANEEIKVTSNSTFVVSRIIDLNGREVVLPDCVTLSFSKNSVIRNGTIIGYKTKIKGNLEGIFDDIIIKGTWDVPLIYSKMFRNVHKDNGLKNVFALASDFVSNHIVISEGLYHVNANQDSKCIIKIPSNTKVSLYGDIILKPNDFSYYNIFRITGNQINIHGKGKIIGDRKCHKGTKGEWGFGIEINNGTKISINNIIVKDCWGDCIYITGRSSNISISNCELSGSRRQGISVVSANNVVIKDCLIYDIRGTSPQRAIDIEPNKNCIVDNVTISNVTAKSCFGGFMALGAAKNARIGKVHLSNCKTIKTKCPYSFSHVGELILINCHSSELRKPIISKCKKVIFK